MNYKEGEGYTDFVMLDSVSEDTFMKNLKERFGAGHIYTYIGEQVVSVNPFTRNAELYSAETMKKYKMMYTYEVPPHIYALGDDVFRCLMKEKLNQCVIITGESGAGKTEASKILMQYLAAVSASRGDGDSIKQKLLESNPVLEAFGNAKTLRNDNSSRFGKYMEIQFDGAGAPVGGKISQYLLEKSRVFTRSDGERSFHIFYQLLSDAGLCGKLQLQADAKQYAYLSNSNCTSVSSINDARDFKEVLGALNTLGFPAEKQASVWRVLAAILHAGGIEFAKNEANTQVDSVSVRNKDQVALVAGLLSCEPAFLERALTSRSISTGAGRRMSTISVFLDAKQAVSTRDSLAKSLYNKLFSWVVETINTTIKATTPVEIVVGVLDIYGFEIFEQNSFEQFCINFCNEKLQQLFIKLVLRQEQEEYRREGITWTDIDFFDNEPICKLIEGSPVGMFKLLDEACSFGQSTPASLLEKFNTNFGNHKHYVKPNPSDKTQRRDAFRIVHYAGNVDYSVEQFLFKNQDTLFEDLVGALKTSKDPLLHELFPDPPAGKAKKVPPTAGTMFVRAVNELVTTLDACQPHYIRCIKSNDNKKANALNEERVRHQVRYLNLVETVRVRRAGFCNRQPYERFLARYKVLGAKTWPIWRGDAKSGVKSILDDLRIESKEYELGNTKLFIRDAKTLFVFERERTKSLPKVVVQMQKIWKGYKARKWFKLALEELRKEKAEREIRLRKQRAITKIMSAFRNLKVRRWLRLVIADFGNVRAEAPTWGRGKKWPSLGFLGPVAGSDAVELVKKVHLVWWGRTKVLALSEVERGLVRQKILACDLFKGKKPWDPKRCYGADYLSSADHNPRSRQFENAVQVLFQNGGDDQILFADDVVKVNPKLKPQVRALIVTNKNIYKYDPKNYKVKKVPIPLASITGLGMSPHKDTFMVIHMAAPERDIVVDLGLEAGKEKVSELAVVLFQAVLNVSQRVIEVDFKESVPFNNSRDTAAASAAAAKGTEHTLIFEQNAKLSGKPCAIKAGKGNQVVVQFG